MKQKEEKSKFSVIIPTLQSGNPDILNYLLNILNADSSVGEIILIDNSLKGYDTSKFFKVNVIIPKKNLFVNPSWNLGISLAKYDYFAILNDDLIIPKNLCEKIMEKFKKEYPGLTGLSNEINNISLPPLDFQKNDSTIETITFKILKRRLFRRIFRSANQAYNRFVVCIRRSNTQRREIRLHIQSVTFP